MNVVEQVNTNPTSTERGNKRQTIRVFKVWPSNTIDAKTAVGDDGTTIPKVGENHPDPREGVVDRIAADYESGSDRTILVQVYYSNDRSWRAAPAMDVLRNQFKSWQVSAVDVSVQFPYAVWNEKLARYAGVAGDVSISGWEVDRLQVLDTRITIQRRIVLNNVTPTEINLILAQNNKLHKIKGSWYKFRFGDIVQQDGDGTSAGDYDNKWETVYIWEGDGGLVSLPPTIAPIGEEPSIADCLYPQQDKPFDGGVYIRPPFHEFVVRAALDPDAPGDRTTAAKRPTFLCQCPYDARFPEGWTTLPGDLGI